MAAFVEQQLRHRHTGREQANSISIEEREVDLEEREKIDNFLNKECGCKLVNNGPCCYQYTKQQIESLQASCAELSWDQLNMTVVGQVRRS